MTQKQPHLSRSSSAVLIAVAVAFAMTGAASTSAAATEQITPVVASVLNAPEPVVATDGRQHLAYELILTNSNRTAATATVQRIDALSGRRVVGSLAGARLASVMVPFGSARPGVKLRSGQTAYVLMDVTFPRNARVPRRLVHRIQVSLTPRNPVAATRYEAAPARVLMRRAILVAPPLRGAGWVAGNGCCDALTAHRGAVLPINGALHAPERFAIDFLQVDPRGFLFSGPLHALSSYPYVGDGVFAATSGTVAGVADNLPDQVPGSLPSDITAATADGNHVVVAIGGGRYELYAHLQPRSILVRVGQRVRVGQELGLLGNSGNSSAPHLHFQVMDTPSPLDTNGLPFRIARFTVDGVMTNFGAFGGGARARIAPTLRGIHRGELPVNNQVLDFG
jgi:Peptidase family M23